MTSESITVANSVQLQEVEQWTGALCRAAAEQRLGDIEEHIETSSEQGNIDTLTKEDINPQVIEPGITYEGHNLDLPTNVDVSMLSADQLRAFNIVKDHFTESNVGEDAPQLLMQIQGEGGTGKLMVISKITELFKLHRQESQLRKSAYTGIAASLIEGSTLHQLALLHQTSKLSKEAIERLRRTWGKVKYLIIDEVLMILKRTLAEISEMIGIGTQQSGENNSTVAFGGINIIIAGNFHQFPPVVGAGKGRGALYSPAVASHGIKAVMGREIYEQFTTVVILKEQFRIQDKAWQVILHRARYGKCTAVDLKAI